MQIPRAMNGSDFSSVTSTKNQKEEKKVSSKKVMISTDPPKESEEQQLYSILPEFMGELIYSDLLVKLLQYDNNLSSNQGMWRV